MIILSVFVWYYGKKNLFLEDGSDPTAILELIFRDEYESIDGLVWKWESRESLCALFLFSGTYVFRIRNQNFEPRLGSDLNWIAWILLGLPRILARLLEIRSPNPRPTELGDIFSSEKPFFSNAANLMHSSRFIPIPESVSCSLRYSGEWIDSVSLIVPESVNFKLFEIKFERIYWINF